MKRNDIRDLASKSTEQLQKQLADLTRDLAERRLAKRVGRLSDLSSLSRLGDDVARIKSVLRQQALISVAQGDKE